MTSEEVVQRQLDHYNQHNLDLFCSMYSSSIKIYSFGNMYPELEGMEALRKRYEERFKIKELNAHIEKRIIKDKYVVDEEHVHGLAAQTTTVIAIYKIENDLIEEVTFIR